jgi:hypothetical protein
LQGPVGENEVSLIYAIFMYENKNFADGGVFVNFCKFAIPKMTAINKRINNGAVAQVVRALDS